MTPITTAIQTAIYHLETLQRVKGAGGVEKKKEYDTADLTLERVTIEEAYENLGFNQALALKDAELAGRLEGLENIVNLFYFKESVDLTQAIRSHILGTGKKEE